LEPSSVSSRSTLSGDSMREQNVRPLNRYIYLLGFFLGATLIPRSLQKFVAIPVGDIFYLLMRRSRQAVKRNLEVIGRGRLSPQEISRLARKTFRNYGQYLLDYMVIHRITSSNKDTVIAGEVGAEYMARALRDGKGAICITPHLGNWEMGGLLLAFRGGTLNVLSLDEPDPRTKAFRGRFRHSKGIRELYIRGGSEDPFSTIELVKALRNNEIVAMLGDRANSSHAIDVDFFGRKTRFPMGVGMLAMMTGAPVLPVFVVMERGRKYRGIIEKPIHFDGSERGKRERVIREGMQEIARVFEDYIRRYPDQWYNFYSYWQ
jgi:KDO2-lipid IV(A) lauroyltransferase